MTTAKISSRLGFSSSGARSSTAGAGSGGDLGSESKTALASEAEYLGVKKNAGGREVEKIREGGSFGLEKERRGEEGETLEILQ